MVRRIDRFEFLPKTHVGASQNFIRRSFRTVGMALGEKGGPFVGKGGGRSANEPQATGGTRPIPYLLLVSSLEGWIVEFTPARPR